MDQKPYIYYDYPQVINQTTYFRRKKTGWRCDGVLDPAFYNGYRDVSYSNIITIRVYDNTPLDLIPITPNFSNLNCNNSGNTYSVPNYSNASYTWGGNFNLTNSLTHSQFLTIYNSFRTPSFNLPAQILQPNYVTVSATGICPNSTLVNTYVDKFATTTIPAFLPINPIQPICNSSSPIYITHLPYVDGLTTFTLTVPSGRGWRIKNYPGTVVSIPENTNIELEQTSPNALISQTSFQIPVQVNYACGTPTTSILGSITVAGYNPITLYFKVRTVPYAVAGTGAVISV